MHDRRWQENRYVYPVVSRRSKGISIGVNLNPDKVCNFDCIYCSVNRKTPPAVRKVDPTVLRDELREMLRLVTSGEIYQFDPFAHIPPELRRVNDIAFSGDGEPTTCRQFPEACRIAAELAAEFFPGWPDAAGADALKLVLITNATMFHRPRVAAALEFLDAQRGEVWAKLDAGTEAYYQLVDRTKIPLQRVVNNIAACAQKRATVIQTLLMKVHGEAPPTEEIAAYSARLQEIVARGGKIKLVQIYTVARATTEAYATALAAEELEGVAERVRGALGGVAVEVYP